MNGWILPTSASIGGRDYKINADYRDILGIIERLNDIEENIFVSVYVGLALFYEDFDSMPLEDYENAIKWMFSFIDCGNDENGKKRPKLIDWEQDMPLIVADINRVAGTEVRQLAFCHWWTFMAWFGCIGEGPLSTVVSIREKKTKGKPLEKWERDYYRENRHRIDFKTKYSSVEEEIIEKLAKG